MTPKEVMQNLQSKIPGSYYFTWGEALFLHKLYAYAVPSQDQIGNIVSVATSLDKVREYYGPLLIESWLRTPLYNDIIKGAKHSAHLDGLAVDFRVAGKQPADMQKELEKRKDLWAWRGERNTPTWVHLDKKGDVWFNPNK